MVKKSHSDNVVGPWAETKLSALQEYLKFYCTALSKQQFRLVYIDGFAGAPLTSIRQDETVPASAELWDDLQKEEQQQFVLGSPIRALALSPGFNSHFFFDLDERRVADLQDLKAHFPSKKIDVRVGDANLHLKGLAAKINQTRGVRGVAFLDPYGPNLEWSTVEALAATKKVEVLINLPIHMAINRLLLKGASRNAEWEAMVDKCFGTDEWRDLVYPRTIDLFGESNEAKAEGVPEKLKELYLRRLKACFNYVAPAKLIRNTRNSPLYYLIWAGPNKAGLKGAEYILGSRSRLAKKNRA